VGFGAEVLAVTARAAVVVAALALVVACSMRRTTHAPVTARIADADARLTYNGEHLELHGAALVLDIRMQAGADQRDVLIMPDVADRVRMCVEIVDVAGHREPCVTVGQLRKSKEGMIK
jgi:hypothetical protein